MACPKCGCKVSYQYDDSDEDLSMPDERLERCSACGEIFDIDDHTPEDEDYDPPPIQSARNKTGHEWDDDAVCIHCGFDSAEWWHLRRNTHPDDRDPDANPPVCTRRA